MKIPFVKTGFLCSIFFASASFAWLRSYGQHDEIYFADRSGAARGIATAPGELILFSNSDLRRTRERLMARRDEPTGLKHVRYPYPARSVHELSYLERYLIVTHLSLLRTGGSGPNPIPVPVFSTYWHLPGIRAQGGKYHEITYDEVVFSFWLVLLLSAPITATSVILLAARRKRIERGLCPNCGYDLRASQDRCPECGHPIPTPQNPPPTPPPAEADSPR